MDIISFTYKFKPEKEGGFSVLCLDWENISTQGETLTECKQNAGEATEMMLELLLDGKINKTAYPKVKKHPASPFHFILSFDIKKAKRINPGKFSGKIIFREIKKIAGIF